MAVAIDQALELLAGSGPEFGSEPLRFSNHGPMAAEALIALGRDDTVIPWTERYKRRLEERPESRDPIATDGWREALGDVRRVGDWTVFFDRELAGAPWREVLGHWVERLAPGIIASATHGVIRTAHAVRSLAAQETPARMHELAEGLAYWAATFMLLPGAPSRSPASALPSQAIRSLDTLSAEEQRAGQLITAYVRKAADRPTFQHAIDLVDPGADQSAFLSDLTETFANVYLASAPGGNVVGLIHAVTGPSAIRLLAPHLSPSTTDLALRYGWQASAALYAAMAQKPALDGVEPAAADQPDLIDRAVSTGDEHAIKFTEACLREHAFNPSPVYLAAALDASARLRRG